MEDFIEWITTNATGMQDSFGTVEPVTDRRIAAFALEGRTVAAISLEGIFQGWVVSGLTRCPEKSRRASCS